jgi:hypothetical protein
MVCGLCAFFCHFCLHEQVDGTVSFSSFNCLSSLESLHGVHLAREERKEIRRNLFARNTVCLSLSKSLIHKECVGNRSLNQTKLRRDNASKSVIEIQELIPWKD